ncbi:hypothetical protein [Rhodococcus gannanensis]|uniref:RelA/SpoT domain-containing protein n=1 Tax=Rhodococcus gannanensis TaxID=1960308 RepID=A0ABW4P1F0_9NOCA
MPVPSAVKNRYASTESAALSLKQYVEFTLRPWCERHSYPFLGRIKAVESISEKLEGGRYKSWLDIDDMYACTIVVPTREHIGSVTAFLNAKFNNLSVKDRLSTRKHPSVYRFDSTRWIGKVPPDSTATLAPGTRDLKFEVQVPTAFEHAWAVATHDIVYKSSSYDWKALRIASLLKASVEQIELIIDGFQSNADSISPSYDPETSAIDEFIQEARRLVEAGDISSSLAPGSWSRFGQNVHSLVSTYAPKGKSADELKKLTRRLYPWAQDQSDLFDLQAGSLFQVILRMINSGEIEGAHLRDFRVVDSDELRSLHGVTALGRTVDLA